MKIKLFTQENCPKCPLAKDIVEAFAGKSHAICESFDITEVEGMVEANFHGVMATPTTLIVDDSDSEIFSWRGEAPDANKMAEIFIAN